MTPTAAEDAFRASALPTAPFTNARPSPGPMFVLRCCDVLPLGCDASWRASSPGDLIHSARQHGASAHGFTPAWYDSDRLAAMAQAVTS